MKQRNWTDADVARMLGWSLAFPMYVTDDGSMLVSRYPAPVYSDTSIPFGLSTPPSPEADANAARYVLPWVVAQGWEYMITNTEAGIDTTPNQLTSTGIFDASGASFAANVCRAALEAWSEMEKNTNG